MSIFVAAGAVFAALSDKAPISLLATVIGILLLAIAGNWMRSGTRIFAVTNRLAALEERVDELAKIAYGARDPLLTWERNERDVPGDFRSFPFRVASF